MSATLIAPKRTAAVPLRWTVADFHRVNATGVSGNRRPVL